MATIADLIMRQGEIAARGAERSGQIWGNAVSQLGQIGANAFEQYSAEKKQKKREEAFSAAVNSWDPADPKGSVLRLTSVVGPEDAMQFANGLQSLEMTMRKNQQGVIPSIEELKAGVAGAYVLSKHAPEMFLQQYPNIRQQYGPAFKQRLAYDLPETPTPEVMKGLEALAIQWGAKGGGQGEIIETTGPGGIAVKRRVSEEELAKGVPVYKAPAKPENLTAEEAFIRAQYGDAPTAQQLLEARSRFAAAGREPKAPKAPDETGRIIARAWAEGSAFPQTQDATTAALVYMDEHPEEFPNRPRKMGVTQQQEVTASTSTLATIADVREAYERIKGKIGPVSYTFNELSRKMPFTAEDPDFVTFNTLLRGMGNLEIKRITGAQMSEQEADRLLKGMATGSLKPKDFEAALKVMERNAKRDRDVRLYGKVVEDRPSKTPAADEGGWTELPGGIKIREKR